MDALLDHPVVIGIVGVGLLLTVMDRVGFWLAARKVPDERREDIQNLGNLWERDSQRLREEKEALFEQNVRLRQMNHDQQMDIVALRQEINNKPVRRRKTKEDKRREDMTMRFPFQAAMENGGEDVPVEMLMANKGEE